MEIVGLPKSNGDWCNSSSACHYKSLQMYWCVLKTKQFLNMSKFKYDFDPRL